MWSFKASSDPYHLSHSSNGHPCDRFISSAFLLIFGFTLRFSALSYSLFSNKLYISSFVPIPFLATAPFPPTTTYMTSSYACTPPLPKTSSRISNSSQSTHYKPRNVQGAWWYAHIHERASFFWVHPIYRWLSFLFLLFCRRATRLIIWSPFMEEYSSQSYNTVEGLIISIMVNIFYRSIINENDSSLGVYFRNFK